MAKKVLSKIWTLVEGERYKTGTAKEKRFLKTYSTQHQIQLQWLF